MRIQSFLPNMRFKTKQTLRNAVKKIFKKSEIIIGNQKFYAVETKYLTGDGNLQ